jgi:hypothetical protein
MMTWLELAVRHGLPVRATLLVFGTVMRARLWLPEPFSFRRVVRASREYRADASAVGGALLAPTLLLGLGKGGY